MKILPLIVLCLSSILSFGQESIEKLTTLDRSLIDSKPFIQKNSEGYLFLNFGKKSIYLDQYDDQFKASTKRTIELPKEIRKPNYVKIDGNVIHTMKVIKPLTLIEYDIDLKTGACTKTKTVDLGNPKELNINNTSKWHFDFREDGSLLLTGNGGTDFDGNHFWRVSVFSINADFTRVDWKYVLDDPEILEKRAVTEFILAEATSNSDFEIYFSTGQRGRSTSYKGYLAKYSHSSDGITREIEEKSGHKSRFMSKIAFDNGVGDTFYLVAPLPIVKSGQLSASIVDEEGNKIHRLDVPKKDYFKTTYSGKTHYVLGGEGEVFIIHSEYAAGNTSTQIAKWRF